MGNRPHSNRQVLQLYKWGAIAVLTLANAIAAVAQVAVSEPPAVQAQIQMHWFTQALNGDPLVATVVLEPTDHPGVARKLRLTTTSAVVVELHPGRYQLTTTAPLVIDHEAYGWNIELALVDQVNYVRLSQENAVRVEAGDVIEPAFMNVATGNALGSESDARAAFDVRKQIILLLNRWATAIQMRDLKTNMSCYAPELLRYLQQQNVSWKQVRARKQKLLQLYTRVQQMQLSDIDVTLDKGQVFATALKKWNLANRDVESRGTVLVNFTFAQIGSQWLITSEWEQFIPTQSGRNAVQATSP